MDDADTSWLLKIFRLAPMINAKNNFCLVEYVFHFKTMIIIVISLILLLVSHKKKQLYRKQLLHWIGPAIVLVFGRQCERKNFVVCKSSVYHITLKKVIMSWKKKQINQKCMGWKTYNIIFKYNEVQRIM